MSLWETILSWFGWHPKSKPVRITPGTGSSRFAGAAPVWKRSNNVVQFPRSAQTIWIGNIPVVRSTLRLAPNTTAMNISGNMPYQTLCVQSPPAGQLSLESDPPLIQ